MVMTFVSLFCENNIIRTEVLRKQYSDTKMTAGEIGGEDRVISVTATLRHGRGEVVGGGSWLLARGVSVAEEGAE
jgi:hypothetical protein